MSITDFNRVPHSQKLNNETVQKNKYHKKADKFTNTHKSQNPPRGTQNLRGVSLHQEPIREHTRLNNHKNSVQSTVLNREPRKDYPNIVLFDIEDTDDVLWITSTLATPTLDTAHVIQLHRATGKISSPEHQQSSLFQHLKNEPNRHTQHVDACILCAPVLNALRALKEMESLQLGHTDWENEEAPCGWACNYALETRTFWHFASPTHLANKYRTHRNIIEKLAEWVGNGEKTQTVHKKPSPVENFSTGEGFFIDYAKTPFGYVHLDAKEHFLTTKDNVEKFICNFFPEAPKEEVCALWEENFSQVAQSLNEKDAFVRNVSLLLLTPQFFYTVLEMFPTATLCDIIHFRLNYLQVS